MNLGLESKVSVLMIASHKYFNNSNNIPYRQDIELFYVTNKTTLKNMNPNNDMNNDNNPFSLESLAEASIILPSTTITTTTEARSNSIY